MVKQHLQVANKDINCMHLHVVMKHHKLATLNCRHKDIDSEGDGIKRQRDTMTERQRDMMTKRQRGIETQRQRERQFL